MTQIPTVQGQMPFVPALSLRKNFSWTLAGNMVYAASQWGILVLLAKLGSPEMVGQFALGLAITAPIILFANFQLRAVQATDARHEYSFADYLGLRLLTTLVAYLVIIGIVMLSDYGTDTALVILLIGLSKSFEAVSDIFFGLLQQHERMDRIAKSLIIEGPLTLAVMAAIMVTTHSIVWATAGMAVVWGLQLALYDLPSGIIILRTQSPRQELLRPRFQRKLLAKLAWLALPLGFVAMLTSLNTNIPRYFIENRVGQSELGIFAAMAYLITAGNTLVRALGQSGSPRLSQAFAQDKQRTFIKLTLVLIGLSGVVGGVGVLAAVVAGKQVLTLFYQADYAEYVDVFFWLMVAAAILHMSSILNQAMIVVRYVKIQVPLFGLVTLVTTIGCLVLIPDGKLLGASIALVLGAGVQFIGSLLVLIYALSSRQHAARIKMIVVNKRG